MGTYGEIITDLTNEEYHAHPSLSKSGLDQFNRSPYHYWLKYLSPDRPPTVWTDAFTIGAALHALVLEPQNYERDYAVSPKFDKRTKAGKEAAAQFAAESEGKIVVTEDQHKLCETLVASINAHPKTSQYLTGFGDAEHSYFFEYGGVELRCRPDYIRDDGMLVDVKTAQSAAPQIWNKKAFDFRYHVQAAMYSIAYEMCTGRKPTGFTFIVVEKAWPHCVLVAECSPDFLRAGYQDFARDLAHFKSCLETDNWPSYNQDDVYLLDIPSYKKKYYEQEEAA